MTQILSAAITTYEQNRDDLLNTAEGKFVLIHDSHVMGLYESKMDAIADGYERFGNVPFLVKQVVNAEAPLNLTMRWYNSSLC